MATVEASTHVDASLAEAWDVYFGEPAWPVWVDGFSAVLSSDGYPDAGSTLRWRSTPAGRGEVTERVIEHEHRRRHLVSFEDPMMEGELETRFVIEGEGARVTQSLKYRLLGGGPIARLGGVLFVRSQVRASMERSLDGFRQFVEESDSV